MSLSNAQDTIDTQSKVLIQNADRSISEIVNKSRIQILRGNVKAIHDSIFMFCDSAWLSKNILTAMGEVVIIQNDTIKIFSDSLYYDGDGKMAKVYKNVVLEKEGQLIFTESLIYDMETRYATFPDTCLLVKETMKLSSLRANYNVKADLAFFYDQVTIIDEDFKMKTDSLMYDTDIDRVYFIAPSYIEQDGKFIYCDEGFYDVNDKRAYFSNSPIYFSGDQFAKSDNMFYSGIDSLTILTGSAFVKDSTSEARAEKITQDDKAGILILEGNASYVTEDKRVVGPKIIYNQRTKDIALDGRSQVFLKEGILGGDTIVYTDSIDFGIVKGNAVWMDTIENRQIEGQLFQYREKDSFFKAIVSDDTRPLVKQVIKEDTLYFSADTLINSKVDDSLSYLQAIRHVRIFKSDLQAVCDSMYYSDQDSILQMFGSPIVWSDTTQFVGDTILLVLKNQEISEIIALGNAFITSKEDLEYYNQIKGKTIHAYLDSQYIDRMVVKGNAESIYFIRDEEKAFIGPNRTLCGHIEFFFDQRELQNVKYHSEPASSLTPLRKAKSEDLKLSQFAWHESIRPLSWADVLIYQLSNPTKKVDSKPVDEFEKAVESVTKLEPSVTKNQNKKGK